ncbi:MAG: L,D-transpeptidase [Clostridium sp.]|nr:MAG: L,D-transpeptidase [Clostridium sp.]
MRNKVRNTYLTGKKIINHLLNIGWHIQEIIMEYMMLLGEINLVEIYIKTNGSHGCVNVPTNMAAKLYSLIEIGTPVYIKR